MKTPEQIKAQRAVHYIANRDRILQYRKEYREKNKEKIYLEKIEYRKNNRDKVLVKKREYYNRKKNDPMFLLKKRIRNSIRRTFIINGYSKKSSTYKTLGCDYEIFKEYIEAQFTSEMNWNNIHLDHIRPIDSATSEKEVYDLNHYTNFQPLLAKDNLVKHTKIIEKQLRLL